MLRRLSGCYWASVCLYCWPYNQFHSILHCGMFDLVLDLSWLISDGLSSYQSVSAIAYVYTHVQMYLVTAPSLRYQGKYIQPVFSGEIDWSNLQKVIAVCRYQNDILCVEWREYRTHWALQLALRLVAMVATPQPRAARITAAAHICSYQSPERQKVPTSQYCWFSSHFSYIEGERGRGEG